MAVAMGIVGLVASAAPAAAQDHTRLVIGGLEGVAEDDARSAFALLLAELRLRAPGRDMRADAQRAPAEAFAACELARCRALWMLRRHAYAVVLVRFQASEDGPSMTLTPFDAGGRALGSPVLVLLRLDASGSFRSAIHEAVVGLELPQPSTAPLLITCDVPGARLYLDERALGVVPLGVTQVPLGRHTLHVSAEGYASHAEVVEVDAGGVRVDVRMVPSPSRPAGDAP
ncbi:MAG: PEGA domain-containing protein [Polyangiales bacterium]|nr:PEGA domain-containing protein [Myxococcales bacterium]MCB9661698.1 PEGA domain-containing protein [Sandaracinaceae bacterium]